MEIQYMIGSSIIRTKNIDSIEEFFKVRNENAKVRAVNYSKRLEDKGITIFVDADLIDDSGKYDSFYKNFRMTACLYKAAISWKSSRYIGAIYGAVLFANYENGELKDLTEEQKRVLSQFTGFNRLYCGGSTYCVNFRLGDE